MVVPLPLPLVGSYKARNFVNMAQNDLKILPRPFGTTADIFEKNFFLHGQEHFWTTFWHQRLKRFRTPYQKTHFLASNFFPMVPMRFPIGALEPHHKCLQNVVLGVAKLPKLTELEHF